MSATTAVAPSDTAPPPAIKLAETPAASSSVTPAQDATKASNGDDAKGKRPANTADGSADAKRRRIDLSIGDRGVFYTTTTPGKAHEARRDLMRLLEDAVFPESAEKAAASTADAAPAADAAKGNASAKLEAELKQMRTKKESFITCGAEVAKGTGFVKFAGDAVSLRPSDAVVTLLEAQKAEFQATSSAPSSRMLCRVLPIDHTCKPHVEDFRKLAKAVLSPEFGPEAEPTVWALEFRARNTTTLKKEAVLSIIDEIVSKDRHKVNLNDPQKCILVEVNPIFCGLSILSRWAELKKYNLHALTSNEEHENKPKKAASPKKSGAAEKAADSPKEAAAQKTPAQATDGATEAAKATGAAEDKVQAPAEQADGKENNGTAATN